MPPEKRPGSPIRCMSCRWDDMKTAPYLSLPPIPQAELASQLRALGLGPGDTVFIHSSLSRIGHVIGGAEAVVAALRDAVGPEGTVAAPTSPFRGSLRGYLESRPFFDLQQTPSQMGAISEALRRHPGAVRSREATHAVAAIGPQAQFLTCEHARSETPCDRHSPFYRLTLVDAWYLLLGVDFRSCTLLHAAEELARAPFIDFETRYTVACHDEHGPYTVCIASHSTPIPARFDAIEPLLAERGLLRVGKVGQAECRLTRAQAILETALTALAEDPYFLRARPSW